MKDNKTYKVYIMMEARLTQLFKKEKEYTVLEKMKGTCVREMQEVYATSPMGEEFTVYSIDAVGVL